MCHHPGGGFEPWTVSLCWNWKMFSPNGTCIWNFNRENNSLQYFSLRARCFVEKNVHIFLHHVLFFSKLSFWEYNRCTWHVEERKRRRWCNGCRGSGSEKKRGRMRIRRYERERQTTRKALFIAALFSLPNFYLTVTSWVSWTFAIQFGGIDKHNI